MTPVEALERVAELLVRAREPTVKAQAFRRAATAIAHVPDGELRRLADAGRLTDLPGIGASTAAVIADALAGRTPAYLERLLGRVERPGSDAGEALRAQLRGDLHLHSDWSDGGSTILEMASKARELGHEYVALTDHSPRLTVANGLTAARLREQLDVVAGVNRELAPFRLLTGIEVDINEDGSLDQEPELLSRLDVVVGSVHSALRSEERAMTVRMVTALANPHLDILGHCTGRMRTRKRNRPPSAFDPDLVFAAAARFDKAIEVNSRPERLDPPKRLLRLAVEAGCRVAIDTDAHAPGQLAWLGNGCERAFLCGVTPPMIVNAMTADDLLAWTRAHEE